MNVFYGGCPSYTFFRNVMQDLKNRYLINSKGKARGNISLPYDDDNESFTVVPVDLLSSILQRLKSTYNEDMMMTTEIAKMINDDGKYKRATNTFNFLLQQIIDNRDTQSDPFCILLPLRHYPFIASALIIEVVYAAENDHLNALTTISFSVEAFMIVPNAAANCLTYQLLISIVNERSIENTVSKINSGPMPFVGATIAKPETAATEPSKTTSYPAKLSPSIIDCSHSPLPDSCYVESIIISEVDITKTTLEEVTRKIPSDAVHYYDSERTDFINTTLAPVIASSFKLPNTIQLQTSLGDERISLRTAVHKQDNDNGGLIFTSSTSISYPRQ